MRMCDDTSGAWSINLDVVPRARIGPCSEGAA
jgi:hypothetical protein